MNSLMGCFRAELVQKDEAASTQIYLGNVINKIMQLPIE